jgi:hypothetical protein
MYPTLPGSTSCEVVEAMDLPPRIWTIAFLFTAYATASRTSLLVNGPAYWLSAR